MRFAFARLTANLRQRATPGLRRAEQTQQFSPFRLAPDQRDLRRRFRRFDSGSKLMTHNCLNLNSERFFLRVEIQASRREYRRP